MMNRQRIWIVVGGVLLLGVGARGLVSRAEADAPSAQSSASHDIDSAGDPVGPFDAQTQAARDQLPRAPKPANPFPASTSCPWDLAPDGPFDVTPGMFRYTDGVVSEAIRVTEGNGHVYEVFAAGPTPPDAGDGSATTRFAGLVVLDYTSRTQDPCRDVQGSTTKQRRFPIAAAPATVHLVGVTPSGLVTFQTSSGQTGTLDPTTLYIQ